MQSLSMETQKYPCRRIFLAKDFPLKCVPHTPSCIFSIISTPSSDETHLNSIPSQDLLNKTSSLNTYCRAIFLRVILSAREASSEKVPCFINSLRSKYHGCSSTAISLT